MEKLEKVCYTAALILWFVWFVLFIFSEMGDDNK